MQKKQNKIKYYLVRYEELPEENIFHDIIKAINIKEARKKADVNLEEQYLGERPFEITLIEEIKKEEVKIFKKVLISCY